MASSLAVSRLQMRNGGSLLKRSLKADTCLHTIVRTNSVAARKEQARKDVADKKHGHKSLYTLQAERQGQAERSVLISYRSKINENKFLKYLSRHGDVNKYFFYESCGTYAVVEFGSQEGVASLLEEAAIPSNNESLIPFKSRLLTLRSSSANSPNQQSDPQFQPQSTVPISQLIQTLSTKSSMDQQITSLTEAHQLTEENSRLRFLVCSLLKDIIAAYFPQCVVRPFGSSVNGFGKLGCDLDMILDLDGISGIKTRPRSGMSLEYQLKRVSTERYATQSILSVLGECVEHFGPGCVGVQKILNARCPLLRFSHQPSNFQCDLTANNRVALKSTELLYLYGELDPRVRHLVFTVRCWARTQGITTGISGAWISNFSLTVMVLFFLQRRSTPIIPTLDHLKDLAGPMDKCVLEGHDCTFASDISKIQVESNTETLEQLLHEFFEFYATFPFSKMSINIRKGKEQNKPEVAPLHIQNPFETSLNVSKNVNATQLERFVDLCKDSMWLLEQSETKTPRDGKEGSNWGLATLLTPQKKVHKKKKYEPATMIKSLMESLKSTQNSPKKSKDS